MNRSIEKGLSSGERQMMARAKRILASEIQYAKDLDEAEAQAYLDELLEEIALERETAASRACDRSSPPARGGGHTGRDGTAGTRDHDSRHPHGLRPARSARRNPDRRTTRTSRIPIIRPLPVISSGPVWCSAVQPPAG